MSDGFAEIRAEHKSVISSLAEIKTDLKDLRNKVADLTTMETRHQHYLETLERAFTRIERLEARCDNFKTFTDRVDGMSKLAYALWVIMASGVVAAIYKAFNGVAA